jgi:hypothetical protein
MFCVQWENLDNIYSQIYRLTFVNIDASPMSFLREGRRSEQVGICYFLYQLI